MKYDSLFIMLFSLLALSVATLLFVDVVLDSGKSTDPEQLACEPLATMGEIKATLGEQRVVVERLSSQIKTLEKTIEELSD